MRKEIKFIYPFSGYSRLDYINCFTSLYMLLEGYDGTEDCYCSSLKVCNSCSNCKASFGKKQEELYFYFGTMTGVNSLRCSFDGQNEMQKRLTNTDEVIDFTMKFVGYEYKKMTGNFQESIIESINSGKPVLARMKKADRGSFRIINGYDEDKLICPEPTGAQRKPEGPPTYDEIENIYIITGKTIPSIGMKDCFDQIIKVMEYNCDISVWDDCIKSFNYGKELKSADFEEIKRRFKRISNIMWFTFNCHNFCETFQRELYHKMEDINVRDLLERKIDKAYSSTHDLAWQVIAMYECRDWSKRQYNELERGMCNSIVMCLKELKKNDEIVLNAMKEAVKMFTEVYKS